MMQLLHTKGFPQRQNAGFSPFKTHNFHITGHTQKVNSIRNLVCFKWTFFALAWVLFASSAFAQVSPSTASVCIGASTTLTDGTPGGAWSSSNTAVATVGSTGIVMGVASGTATITYVVSGTPYTAAVTVNPFAGVISGLSNVCIGSSVTLTSSVPGGTWSANNTIVAVGSSSGI